MSEIYSCLLVSRLAGWLACWLACRLACLLLYLLTISNYADIFSERYHKTVPDFSGFTKTSIYVLKSFGYFKATKLETKMNTTQPKYLQKGNLLKYALQRLITKQN